MTQDVSNNKPAQREADNGVDKSASKRHWTLRCLKAIGYRIFRLSGEFTAILLGIAFIWGYLMNTLLAQKTLDVSVMEPNVALWFADAFDGRAAEIGSMTLKWQPADGTITFEVADIEVKDNASAITNQIGSLKTAVDFEQAMRGHVRLRSVDVSGGAVTWRKDKNGRVIAGVGTPETVGRFATFPVPQPADGVTPQPAKRRPFSIGNLNDITITDATVYVVDEQRGLDLHFKDADLSLVLRGEQFYLDAAANLQSGEADSRLTATADFSPDYEDFTLAFTADNFNPAQVLPNSGWIVKAGRLDALTDINLNVVSTRASGLEAVLLEMQVGNGDVTIGTITEVINAFNVSASYDPLEQVLNITQVGLDAEKYGFSGTGQMTNIGRPAVGFFKEPTGFKANLTDTRIDARQYFDGSFALKSMDVAGGYDPGNAALVFTNIGLEFPEFGIETRLELAQNAAGGLASISGNGRLNGTMTPEHLMALWPTAFSTGARRWIDRAILKGTIENLKFDFNIPEAAIKGELLSEDAVNLAFDVREADVRYISTMTPYTNAAGRGVLHGNSFEFDAVSGNVGGLNVQSARVEMPRLNPKGGDLIIDIKGEGSVADMLTLIDQKPFQFTSRYGLQPDSFAGTGDINLTITRPLLEFFDEDRIKYSVEGDFTGVKVPFSFGPHPMENGRFKLRADKTGIKVSGPVDIAAWDADLLWQQPFGDVPGPTLYSLKGPMDREALDGFGIGFREYFGGHIQVEIEAAGKGLAVSDAKFKADLDAAELRIGEYWSKAKGVKGDITADLSRGESGALSAKNVVLSAPGMSLIGSVAFADNMRLLEFVLDDVKVDGLVDGSLKVAPSQDLSAFDIYLRGNYLDVTPFVTAAIAAPSSSGMSLPINLDAKLERLALNPAYILQKADLQINHNGVGTEKANITGLAAGSNFSAIISKAASGQGRHLKLDVPDASQAAVAFFNIKNIKGGRFQLDASLPGVGLEGPMHGTLKVDDFTLVNAPIFAQMLSLASLKGLSDAMGGAGLNFNILDVPFSFEKGELNVREARASGPALGLTGSGDIDLGKRIVDFDGVLVPAYNTNSVLASVPVIGDIFVGKKGEGIFALNYAIKGPFSKTQVSVNPLSALTPGILRGIFGTQRDALPEMMPGGEMPPESESLPEPE